MASTANPALLPVLEQAIATTPSDQNPYAYFAGQLSWAVYPGIAPWSKPIFLIFGVISFLNIFAAIFALWIKWRREGSLPLYKMTAHRSGSRFICLNSTNVFLVFHLLSSMTFTVFPILHCFEYKHAGKTHMDLSWAVLMWLAPYIGLLLTCFGALYALLVPPVSMTERQPSGELVHSSGPLARLPCWLLNSIVIAAPILVTASVLIPGLRLMISVQYTEAVAVEMTATLLEASNLYDRETPPPLSWQAAILQDFGKLAKYGDEAANRWRPLFGVWAGWDAISALMAIAASVAIHKVTKKRLRSAQRNYHSEEDSQDSEFSQITSAKLNRQRRKSSSADTLVNHQQQRKASLVSMDPEAFQRQQAAIERARWDHYNLTAQFVSAAVLFLIIEVCLFFDVILGYQVHLRIDLLAISLLVPIIAYVTQGSIAVTLIIIRNVQGKAAANAPLTPSSPSVGLFKPMSSLGGRIYPREHSRGVVRVRADSEAPLSSKVVQVQFSQTQEIATDGDDSIINISYSPSMDGQTAATDSSCTHLETEKDTRHQDLKREADNEVER